MVPGPRLYDPAAERDACGVGFVADTRAGPSRSVVDSALEALARLRHRGAVAADQRSGDGAGVLLPLRASWFTALVGPARIGMAPGTPLGAAMLFLSGRADDEGARQRRAARALVDRGCARHGMTLLGWRSVPVDSGMLGERARQTVPVIEQAILTTSSPLTGDEAERRCLLARKWVEARARDASLPFYAASWSFRTITYKAMCAGDDLAAVFPDLRDPALKVPFCIFHQRFSTNTAPSWERAQPFRLLGHNGEINTIQGNVNWMRARAAVLGADEWATSAQLRPVIDGSGSDSAMLDNALELLLRGGRDVRHALTMLVPPAWEDADRVEPAVRDFHRYHATLMEPWDGPAALVFTDGIRVGACLDRNGLRPLRYALCEDGFLACASEAGAVSLGGHGPVRHGKLGPGQMLCLDPERGVEDGAAITARLAAQRPYGEWLKTHVRVCPVGEASAALPDDLERRQAVFGYTKEEVTYVLRPMATQGKEPTASMGDDTAPAVLARRSRLLYHYFAQRFAQVTNPPIDHLRERGVMSLRTWLGPRLPLLRERPEGTRLLELESFLLFPSGLASLAGAGGPLEAIRLDATFPVAGGPDGLERACVRLGGEALAAIRRRAGLLLLTDAAVDAGRAPIPALLAVGAVHQRLLQAGVRSQTSLLLSTDEAREVHHFACLLGYGADAICPRLAVESIAALAAGRRMGGDAPDPALAQERFLRAVEDGVLKVLSKMGVATIESYRGAQVFEAIGLGRAVIDRCFRGTPSPIGGVTFCDLGDEVLARHRAAFAGPGSALVNPGYYKHHQGAAEYHTANPEVVEALQASVRVQATAALQAAHALQRAVRAGSNGNGPADYRRFVSLVTARPPTEVRDLLDFHPAAEPVPLEQVEAAASIVRRFSTGAMSLGSIGAEAHQTVALALNRLGARSNTGEGGEDPARFRSRGSSHDVNSRIKQVASGRFGVTAEYCAFADELQIKIAQGSKPGEGGQLPGHKATAEIARLRHTQPGVALISPPPHHDIYSIEDLAQLIFDLKQVNPLAAVSVKLVASSGIGTIAAGVAKGLADVIHVAGASGGTGASPLSSIKHAGLPWELGLAETQQALRVNGLRGRVRLRVDGGLKSGRDVVAAALLGADEYSFGTAVLIAQGCIMARTCHLDTCPVGIATQRPELRAKFAGTPEMVIAYLEHVAEEVRRILAGLGLRRMEDAIGRVDLLRPRAVPGGRAQRLDLRPLLWDAAGPRRFLATLPIQRPAGALGDRLVRETLARLRAGERFSLRLGIGNQDRAVGARLGGVVAREFGLAGPPGQATVFFDGAAGQSFGAFLVEGIELVLTGLANDYVGKAMSGGRIVIRPPVDAAAEPVLAGNTVLYGATGGELFCAGVAGERFAVRNSGATAVVEGAFDHACEYMTGGTVVILGAVGRNVAAGMTGGEVFLHEPSAGAPWTVNRDLVDVHRAAADGAVTDRLRRLVERHRDLTGSARAAALLERWEERVRGFWRVTAKQDVASIERTHEGTPAGRG